MRSWKVTLIALFVLLLFLITKHTASAQSTYVLPYPSFMPGTIFYKLNLIEEKLMFYWYFGNFGKHAYNLKLADKYLVEAKTLFEYKQYLLAHNALLKSDEYFKKAGVYLLTAQTDNKNIKEKKVVFKEASLKHIEELELIRNMTPEKFVWTPEKSKSTILNISEAIKKSVVIRRVNL